MKAKYKQILLTIILGELPGCKVYLFGSRAREEHDMGADIDLALDTGEPIERAVLVTIKEKIEATTIPLSVDLIDLSDASGQLKKEIETEGILWES